MMSKLSTPARCSLFIDWMRLCGQDAHWLVDGEAMCDEHIQDIADGAGFNDEDEAVFQPALDEIAQRTVTQGEQAPIPKNRI